MYFANSPNPVSSIITQTSFLGGCQIRPPPLYNTPHQKVGQLFLALLMKYLWISQKTGSNFWGVTWLHQTKSTLLIKIFGADFENDPGKILLCGNVHITSPTNYQGNYTKEVRISAKSAEVKEENYCYYSFQIQIKVKNFKNVRRRNQVCL